MDQKFFFRFLKIHPFLFGLFAATNAHAQKPVAREPFLEDLPPGVFLASSFVASEKDTEAIGAKLGGEIARLSNSVIVVNGRPIKVNGIRAKDEAEAAKILRSLKKPDWAAFRDGAMVIEFSNPPRGPWIDGAIATKAVYELGLKPKPEKVRYQITAEVAAVAKGDYMAANPLFNAFLKAGAGDAAAAAEIDKLAGRFTFGNELTLRNLGGAAAAAYRFEPMAAATEEVGESGMRAHFGKLLERKGVPFVRVQMTVDTDSGAMTKTEKAPGANLVAATPFWPADDPEVKTLAAKITGGARGNQEKADAVLNWIAGNLRYGGTTGSRWGTAKVFEQKFGHCWDFSDVFVTLTRAAGVPSRQVAGWLYGASGHVWAEFYDEEKKGWQQVDPTGGGVLACGIYHIPWFTTEDGAMPIVYLSMPVIEAVPPR